MIERRTSNGQIQTSGNKLVGLASPTYDGTDGTQYQLWDNTFERFEAGAFDKTLSKNPDVVALLNHDSNFILGRTPNTLTLRADNQGLHYEIDLPNTQAGNDLKISVGRGDIKGSSFAFKPTKVEWIQEGKNDIRMVQEADLFDVSVVVNPAYKGSNAGLRSQDERKSIEQEKNEYRKKIETEKWIARMETLK